jgi:hypothetical protein
MTAQAAAYLVTGLVLVAALAGVAVHTYARKRRDRVEQPKYKMLDDD